MFRRLVLTDTPTFHPVVNDYVTPAEEGDALSLEQLIEAATIDISQNNNNNNNTEGFSFNSILHYHAAYKSGQTTPLQVTRNVIKCIEDTVEKGLRIIVGLEEHHKEDILKRAQVKRSYLIWSSKS